MVNYLKSGVIVGLAIVVVNAIVKKFLNKDFL